jgi:hypothetical protein
MRSLPRAIATIAVSAALLGTSAIASAAPAAQAPASGWTALSQLNPAGAMALSANGAVATPTAATLAGTAAAAQPADDNADYRPNPLPWPVIGVLLAVIGTAIYIAFIEDHGRSHHIFLTSPQ